LPHVARREVDVRDGSAIETVLRDAHVVVHAAGQVAVTTSMVDPRTDFEINAAGTFNVLEGARKAGTDPVVVFCSTNKVYGGAVNAIPIKEEGTRYGFADPALASGIPERFPTDHVHHTPYGASKFAADVYVQEYAHTYGLRTGVFRMSCIYGPRQFGMEDQGWVAHFAISSILGRPLTIYGDGKQVRDVLYVKDLVDAYFAYVNRSKQLGGQVFNIGGGPMYTMSLLELVEMLEKDLGRRLKVSFSDWRPADQKVYVSDIRKAEKLLGWRPEVGPEEGVRRILKWTREGVIARSETRTS
jgi:CDP-paratose 2-epimerase